MTTKDITKRQKTRPVDHDKLATWQKEMDKHTIEEVRLAIGKSFDTARRALSYGIATPDTEEKIDQFFFPAKKKRKMKT